MLAAVEHQQHFLITQKGNQPRDRVVGPDCKAEHGGKRAWHKKRVGQRREIDKANTITVGRRQSARHRKSNCRLTDTAGSHQRDEAPLRQLDRDRLDDFVASHYSRGQRRQIMRARGNRGGWRGRRLLGGYGDRSYEAIAATGNIGDVSVSTASVAKRPAQCCDVNPEISFFDEGVRPHTRDQILLADNCAGMLSQGNQDIERATAEVDRAAVLEKQLLRWKKPKWR